MNFRLVLFFSLAATIAFAQAKPQSSPPSITYLRCGTLYDGKSDTARKNVTLRIVGEKIDQLGDNTLQPESGAQVIDLTREVCLPGLIDTHTHVLLQGDITAEDYDVQLLKYSTPYRTILGTVAAQRALGYGFTTIRDLETEGAGYADVDIKHAIEAGVIPGPRMQVAGRAMDVTGSYPLLGYSWELKMPKGVQEVDGAEGGRKAVREQLSNGVDWIKVYSDRSYRVRPDGVLDDIPTFTLDELRAIVDEAHRERHKVASHASALNGVHNSVEAGVDSIEHGFYIADADLKTMAAKGTFYVPTLFVGEYVADRPRGHGGARVAGHDQHSRRHVSARAERRREDRLRHRRRWIRLDHRSREGICPDGEVRYDPGAGFALSQHERRRTAGHAGPDRLTGARQVRRHCRRARRSHGGHHSTGARELRDEGRRGV